MSACVQILAICIILATFDILLPNLEVKYLGTVRTIMA